MPGATHIEWTDAVWNPVTGCSKVSAGCKNCYAELYFKRPYPGRKFTDVRTHPERLDWPLRWRGSKQAKQEGRPSRIFVNSMSDLFHDHIPQNFVTSVFLMMEACPQHIFQVLTKRPENAKWFCEQWPRYLRTLESEGWYPETVFSARAQTWARSAMAEEIKLPFPNVWLGVSVEDQKTAARSFAS